MNKELISVIVPVYNVEKYLPKCIESIINQTYDNLEIILVDDGSTDSSGNICDKYKNIDNRITVVHQENSGLSSARNKGLDLATGSLIAFVDSDDYLETTMYEELKNNMDKYSSDISVCDYYYIDKNGNRIEHSFSEKELKSIGKDKFANIRNEYSSVTAYAWNKLYKKSIFDEIRYPEGMIYEFSYVLCDVLEKAKAVSYLLKPLYNYVYRCDSIGNSFSSKHFNRVDALNRKIDFFNKKGYYDLELKEKNIKMNRLITDFIKIKRSGIKDKEIEKKYCRELKETSKEVAWKDISRKAKFYKAFGRAYIRFYVVGSRVKGAMRKMGNRKKVY